MGSRATVATTTRPVRRDEQAVKRNLRLREAVGPPRVWAAERCGLMGGLQAMRPTRIHGEGGDGKDTDRGR